MNSVAMSKQRTAFNDEIRFKIMEWTRQNLMGDSDSGSSHQSCSIKKGVLRNFAKFTGKHLWQSLFFNKVAGAACNFIKKETNLPKNFLFISMMASEQWWKMLFISS